MEFAKANHPKEFVALLKGRVKDETLILDGLYYQPFNASSKSAFITFNIPYMPDMIGSVHSHPSSNVRPSKADIRFFSKKGAVHFIIGYPYTKERLACYNTHGNALNFEIEETD